MKFEVHRGAYIKYFDDDRGTVTPVELVRETKQYYVVKSPQWVDPAYFSKRTRSQMGVSAKNKHYYSRLVEVPQNI